MIKHTVIQFGIATILFCGCACAETTLYVAPDGNDANAGSADQPLASIVGARDVIRQMEKKKPVKVVIGSGTYFIDKTIVFKPVDSGTETAPIIYEGAGTGKTIVSGGISITGWRKGAGNLWQARVDRVAAGELYFHQLFVNGQRARRAISPNRFYHRSAGPVKGLGNRTKARKDPSKKEAFRFREGDLREWDNLEDVMLKVYHSWTVSLHWIAGLDMRKHIVKFTNQATWPMSYWEKFERYQVENCFEALDSPGEWYLNRQTGMLYYWPRPGEKMKTAEVIAPVLTELVRFEGDPDKGAFVEQIRLRGVSFEHADWKFERNQPVDGQAHVSPKSSAVKAIGLRHSVVEDCEIAHVGSHAIWLEKGSQDNRIARCHIHDAGGGGIYVGEAGLRGGMPPNDNAKVQRNHVDNNYIHDITHLLGGSIGIWVGTSAHNTVSHNEISDFGYTGISVGWCWGREKEIFQQENIIEYNHVHHTTGEILSDNGGIYVLGWSPGSIIRNNLIHDIYFYPYINDSRGIYLDGNSSCYLVENNICHHIGSYGITIKGEYNIVRNNIFAFCGDSGLNRVFKAGTTSFEYDQNKIHHNIVMQQIQNMTSGYYHKKWTEIDDNLYWSIEHGADVVFNDLSKRIIKEAPAVDNMPFAQWQALGRDTRSLTADPGFIDAANADFRLRSDSPAKMIGYRETDTAKAGLYGDEDWTGLPGKHPIPALEYAPPPPREKIDYDFESDSAGGPPVVGGRLAEDGKTSITVTDRTAAAGLQSLMFSDGPSTAGYHPHWSIQFDPQPGPVKLTCDIRLDPALPATAQLEFRDYTGAKWKGGPSLKFLPDGKVKMGKTLAGRFAPGTWVHVELELMQGEGRPGSCRLRIGETGTSLADAGNVPFVSEEFTSSTWFGFSCPGEKKAAFYIDNLKLDFEEMP